MPEVTTARLGRCKLFRTEGISVRGPRAGEVEEGFCVEFEELIPATIVGGSSLNKTAKRVAD
jgi:hypothetical protein